MSRLQKPHLPLVDFMPIPGVAGRVGLTACPGQLGALDRDLQSFEAMGVSLIVTLIGQDEMADLRVSDLGNTIVQRGLVWAHTPIPDFAAPQAGFDIVWRMIGADIHYRLDQGETILIHCRAGLGRSGTVAARILIERGADPDDAMAWVRQHRPGAIETPAQEDYLRSLGSISWAETARIVERE